MPVSMIAMYYDISPDIVAFSTERQAIDPFSPYDGFNITHYSGDDPQHVADCRKLLCQQLNIDDQHLVLPRQVHGTRIEEVNEQTLAAHTNAFVFHTADSPFEGVDALITTMPHTCIGVSTADCVPLLFYDCQTGAIAAAHAGWRGTVARIGRLTLTAMQDRYGTRAADVRAVIAPSIGPEAFEVGDEVYEQFQQAQFQMSEIAFKRENRWHIDLWQANALDLADVGVPADSINVTAICTHTHYNRFFSARRLGINSGRVFTGICKRS